MLTHLFFNIPAKSYSPAIANIKKKNRRTITVSLNSGSDASRADTITLSPYILEIDFRGLSTLKALRPVKFTLPPYKMRER